MNNSLDNFKNPELAKKLVSIISSRNGSPIKLMELCGTHTMSIFKSGIRSILPKEIKLVSGPGCPVCVTPNYYIDAAIRLTEFEDVIVATFGDMMRVPGNKGTLTEAKAQGKDVKIVYSPLDCLKMAQNNSDKRVVFLSIGFETTTPVIALTVKKAKELNINNFFVLTANKTMPEVLEVLASDKDLKIDGFIYPGHVCSITGTNFCENVSENHRIPGVVAGFEPVDILLGIKELIDLIDEKSPDIKNYYPRIVNREGNEEALKTLNEVFRKCDANWRGIGLIKDSGMCLNDDYSEFDAWKVFELQESYEEKVNGCICGEILKGVKDPCDCPLFKTVCSPENPKGACMVSSEGSCAAFYKYGQ